MKNKNFNDDDSTWSSIQQAKKNGNNFYNTNENCKKPKKYKKIDIISPMFGSRSSESELANRRKEKLNNKYLNQAKKKESANEAKHKKTILGIDRNQKWEEAGEKSNENDKNKKIVIPEWLTTELKINNDNVDFQNITQNNKQPKDHTEEDDENFINEYTKKKKNPLFD